MNVSLLERNQTERPARRLVAWAWVAIGLAPVGVALAVVALFSLASLMNVELFPADESQGATFLEGLILTVVTAVVAVVAPTVAVILSVKATRNDEPSAKAARIVAIALLAVVSVLLLLAVGPVVGAVGLALVGLVLAAVLRPRRLAP